MNLTGVAQVAFTVAGRADCVAGGRRRAGVAQVAFTVAGGRRRPGVARPVNGPVE